MSSHLTRHPYHLVAMFLLADALAAVVTVLVLFRTVFEALVVRREAG